MARGDWFRNTDWNPEIEAAFFQKLKRAHKRNQYLRVQALTLCQSHPKVALALLERYFESGDDHFDANLAFKVRAEAHLALGEIDAAEQGYEDALAREELFPNSRTDAYLDLPYLVATKQRRDKYDRALELLARRETMLFPYQFFKREASLALILADLGDMERARTHAAEALRYAEAQDSGLPYHSHVGLVGLKFEDTRARLKVLVEPDKQFLH